MATVPTLTSAGVKLHFAIETTPGTRPVTGYAEVIRIKTVPDLNPSPSNLDATDLSATEYKSYVAGLKDIGDSLEFTANFTEDQLTNWQTHVDAAEAAIATGKGVWYTVIIPGLTKSFYFAGTPVQLGLSSIDVDSVIETSVFITPNEVAGWAVKPT